MESQKSGSMVASTKMVTLLVSWAAQMLAANWNAFRRCAPSVVIGLPPTGATTVGSLKPSPAPSLLTIVIVAACVAGASAVARRPSARKAAEALFTRRMLLLLELGGRSRNTVRIGRAIEDLLAGRVDT